MFEKVMHVLFKSPIFLLTNQKKKKITDFPSFIPHPPPPFPGPKFGTLNKNLDEKSKAAFFLSSEIFGGASLIPPLPG